ncbi:MAG: hypothetical protein IJH07_02210 [Ruminococcus sp.]|nr:hypothetical protein [Ruminococcus sp.]
MDDFKENEQKEKEKKHPAIKRRMLESEISRVTEELTKEVEDCWQINESVLAEDKEVIKLSQSLLVQFQNPNKAFFDKLTELTMSDGRFKINRLNFGIKTNTLYDFAVPVRRYATVLVDLYHFKSGSFWSSLSSNDKTFSKNEKISREEAIAFAFAYRLSSNQLNVLLESLGFSRLYPRQIMDAALIFSLDTYLCSQAYDDFANRYGPLKPEEYAANYVIFEKILRKENKVDLSLMQSPFMRSLQEQFSNDTKKLYKKGHDNWYISRKRLREIILQDISFDVNLTAEGSKKLYELIENVNEYRQFGNLTWFKDYLNTASLKGTNNREMFVQNSEKSLLYLLKMMYRYLQTKTIRSVKKGTKQPNGIRLSMFFTRFTEFLDKLNLINPKDLFICEYVQAKTKNNKNHLCFSYSNFCEDFLGIDYDELPNALRNKTEKLLILYIKYILDMDPGPGTDDYSELQGEIVSLDKKEEKRIGDILKAGKKKRELQANRLTNYKKLFSGADISRLMFILVYLFTYVSESDDSFTLDPKISIGNFDVQDNKKKSVYYSNKGSFEELNYWLFDSGFPKLTDSEPLKNFVCGFMNQDYYEKRQKVSIPVAVKDSNLLKMTNRVEKTPFEKSKAEYVAKVFRNVIIRDKSLDMLSKLHLSSYSLFTAETELLPKYNVGEKNDPAVE